MSTKNPEVRSEVGRLRASENEARVLASAFDEGRFAFVSGIPRDACRFRNASRRNAWARGWLEAERERGELDAVRAMSEEEKRQTLERLSVLKSITGA